MRLQRTAPTATRLEDGKPPCDEAGLQTGRDGTIKRNGQQFPSALKLGVFARPYSSELARRIYAAKHRPGSNMIPGPLPCQGVVPSNPSLFWGWALLTIQEAGSARARARALCQVSDRRNETSGGRVVKKEKRNMVVKNIEEEYTVDHLLSIY